MLEAFEIQNFKSYETAKLPLAPLTVLVGANASGKSNLIEALQLLAWLAHGRRLGDLATAMREHEVSIRGRLADLPLDAGEAVTLRCTIARDDDSIAHSTTLNLTIGVRMDNGGPRVVREELDSSETTPAIPFYYKVVAAAPLHGSELEVAYNNFTRGRTKPQIRCIDQQAIFTQLLTPARFEHQTAQEKIPAACSRIGLALTSTLFLDPNPRAMRGYAYADEHVLTGTGANVSATLAHLCDEAGAKERILEFIRALPEQDIVDIDFHRTDRNEVLVKLAETFGGDVEWRDATVLSDGTLRVLAIAAAVLSVEPGSVVVIEEIDNGVHPSRAAMLLTAIQSIANERRIRVLLTTHNPALVDAIPKAAIPHVIACYRDPSSGKSRLVRLSDLDDYAALVAQGPLGLLMQSGTLDKYLKRKRSLEEREREAQSVLQLFRRNGS
jgi:predicted ATPase